MKRNSKQQPLSGIRVLVGRARHQAGALSSALREAGAEVIEIPFIEIRKPKSYKPLDEALRQLHSYDWLILTSVNGVATVWERLNKLGLEGHKPTHLKIAAIGPATKRAIEERGFKVNVVPKQYVAESVVESLRGRVKGKRVLLARAKIARDVIPEELRKAGAHVDVVEAYETVIPRAGRTRLSEVLRSKKQSPHIITFTSSSTAKNFAALLKLDHKGKPSRRETSRGSGDLRFASIGPITSATLRELGFKVHVEAREYTIGGLVAAIVSARGESCLTESANCSNPSAIHGMNMAKPNRVLFHQDCIRQPVLPGQKVPLTLSGRERELILEHTFADDESTALLRLVPTASKKSVYSFTLDDLEELAGYVAAEANHAKDKKLQKELHDLLARMETVLQSYTDEGDGPTD